MNKTAIKNYAVWARNTLIKSVALKAYEYGITEEAVKAGKVKPSREVLKAGGGLLNDAERRQRDALLGQITRKGFTQVMEEAAYTWFNRFTALKYMESNGVLPLPMRVLPGTKGELPEIITGALNVQVEGVSRESVLGYLERNDTDGLYRHFIIALCNSLHVSLPGMFEPINDYTELLFPDNLLKNGSVLQVMAVEIPAEDWESIEIVGWLYQYYISELKDETFALLKQNVKITKERIGAATQLFTPEWIVRYMVENSLGRLWLEGHPGSTLQAGWKYYLQEAEQEPEVRLQFEAIREGYRKLRPEDVKVIDPCMGSGHILVYAFDLLMQIYRSQGYTDRDAAESIVRHNLYGLDIDDRAAQLAYFAVMMKAVQYDKCFLRRGIQPNLCAIQESNGIEAFDKLHGQMNLSSGYVLAAGELITQFKDAKTYGSLLDVRTSEIPMDFMDKLEQACSRDLETLEWYLKAQDKLPELMRQAQLLSQKYDVVVTNPPYMGSSGMAAKLADFVKSLYPDSKSDLFACFIEKCGELTKKNGYQAMITQHAWMFLSSFEKLRAKLLKTDTVNMAHLGARSFEEIGGEVVQTTSFVLRKSHIIQYKGTYCRLIDPTTQQGKEDMFLANENRYTAQQDNFSKVPGSPIAYWVSKNLVSIFVSTSKLYQYSRALQGTITGDNERFLRFWFEVNMERTAINSRENASKWIPHSKGGTFRRWFGNNEYLLNWENEGHEIRTFVDANGKLRSRPQNIDSFFIQGITWSDLTMGSFSARYVPPGFSFDATGPTMPFHDISFMNVILAYMNTPIFQELLNITCPGLHYNNGIITNLPLIINGVNIVAVETKSKDCVLLSRADWNQFETSWDFEKHPMI